MKRHPHHQHHHHHTSPRLRINEVFLSIQGESTFAGLPCVFIRTTGCPLRCSYCDTTYAFDEGTETPLDALLGVALGYGVPLIEVTGGEPLAQRGTLALLSALADSGATVLLETSGALDIAPVDPRVRIIMDVKCPGSGEQQRNRLENLALLRDKDEVKFVCTDRADYDFARELLAAHGLLERCAVLFSPAAGLLDAAELADWLLDDRLVARLQLQLQRVLWPAVKRGV